MTEQVQGRIFTRIAETALNEAEYLAGLFGKYASASCDMPLPERKEIMGGVFESIGKRADDLGLCGHLDRAQHILDTCKRDARGDADLFRVIETKAAQLQKDYSYEF